MALRASRRADTLGSRSRTRVALIDWLAPIHMNAAMATSQITLVRSRFSPWARVQATGSAISATAISRPTQAAATVATAGRPEAFQMMARSIRPPSSGRPGSRLNTPTTMLAQQAWRTMTQTTLPAGDRMLQPEEDRGQHEGQKRPGPGHGELPARGLRLDLDLGHPAQRVEQDPAHRQTVAAGHHRVTQLVDQHRDVEQDHEHRGHHVAGTAVQRARQVVGVQHDEHAGDDEPVRGDLHRNAERPRHDDPRGGDPRRPLPLALVASPAAGLVTGLVAGRHACHMTDATCPSGWRGRGCPGHGREMSETVGPLP